MFCPKCGIENPDNGKFCRTCGTDVSGVADVVSGELRQPEAQPQLLNRKGKRIGWDSAINSTLLGLAFLAIAMGLGISKMGGSWWYWMLIPAASFLGTGISQIIQLKKYEQTNTLKTLNILQKQIPKSSPNLNLPPTQTEYVKPQGSIYDTGEFVVLPSVTEHTTRHLQMDTEGETMTLPKK